jgi:hypothetical protein
MVVGMAGDRTLRPDPDGRGFDSAGRAVTMIMMNQFPPDQIDDAEVEIVDGLPVLAEVHELQPAEHGAVSVVHAAAMTAGGFFAGALAMALLKNLAARRAEQPIVREPMPSGWPVGSSRTYLVNVRVISRPAE